MILLTKSQPKPREIRVGITALDHVDFEKIDERIVHNSGWASCYPAATSISVPIQHAKEILTKLEQHPGVIVVNGELTVEGTAFMDTRYRQVNAK